MNRPLEKAMKSIISTADPDKIILFGSRASGRHDKNSDYDLLVLKKSITHKRLMVRDIYRNLIDIGAPIDVIVEQSSVYNKAKSNKFYIYYQADRTGKIIYEKK